VPDHLGSKSVFADDPNLINGDLRLFAVEFNL